MKKQTSIIIFVWTAILVGWTLASPPSGTIGTSVRSLFTDSTGNIGIKTSSPATLLDVNGTTTIRNSLDMTGNKILAVATPTLGTDAVNKAYVDTVIGSMGPAIKLWGEGRPGATVMNTAGQCTSTMTGPVIKVSRSNRVATWDGARAACPLNWWVCSAAERGTRVCGNTLRNIMHCNVPSTTDDLGANTANWGWVTDTGTIVDANGSAPGGMIVQAAANPPPVPPFQSPQYTCNIIPVWCCSY